MRDLLISALLLFLAAFAMIAAGVKLISLDRADRSEAATLSTIIHAQQLDIAERNNRLAVQGGLLRAAHDRLLTCRTRE